MSTNKVSTTFKFLRCRSGSEIYCIDLSLVRSIQHEETLQPCGDNEEIVGSLTIQQERLPVYNLARLLKRSPEKEITKGPILVLKTESTETASKSLAIMVDLILGINEVLARDIKPLPASINNLGNLFSGLIKIGDEYLFIIKIENLALVEQLKRVSNTFPVVKNYHRNRVSYQKQENDGQLIIFSQANVFINGNRILFGLSIRQVCEIIRPPNITPIPLANNYFLGIINFRDQAVMVIDLNARLGWKSLTTRLNKRLIITKVADKKELLGFLIQPSTKVSTIPRDEQLFSTRITTDSSCIRGVFQIPGEILVIPELANMV